MEKSKFELDEEKAKHSILNPTTKQKKPRRVAVKNPSFFLFKKISENGDLSPIGFYETESEVHEAYERTLDAGTPQDGIRGFKGRVLDFEVTETKRRITVR